MANRDVVAAVRNSAAVGQLAVGNIDEHTDWLPALAGCDVVVHLAARVHLMRDEAVDPLVEYRRVNTAGTLSLARQAVRAGVRRFVFVSTIKVNGESTGAEKPFRFDDTPAPADAYGLSKCEAEVGLWQISAETGLEVVIIRPPLVYGPGVKGNFSALMHGLRHRVPMPLGAATHNRRSLVALDNLVGLIVTCLDHPAAANQVFLVSDGEDLSTADLLRRLGGAMGTSARLLSVPPAFLQFAARLLGKGDVAQRLLGDLQVDILHTKQVLDWEPSISVDEGFKRATQDLVQ